MTKESHIRLLAIFHITLSSLLLFIGIIGFFLLSGIGYLTDDTTAFHILGFIGTIALLFFSFLAVPGIIGGIGILQRQSWARILLLVVGVLQLFDIPIGTALGIYTFFVLADNEARTYFENQAATGSGQPL
ncbi:MAG: hypothetical protein V1799_08880 [bacterium]